MTIIRRLAIFNIREPVFLGVLNGQWALDLPEDAQILNVQIDHMRQTVELLVSSIAYEEVPEAVIPPTRDDLSLKEPKA